MTDMLDNVLASRVGSSCGLPRPPGARWQQYSTTIGGTFDAGGNATVSFEAERDTLFIGMSVDVTGGAENTHVYVNASYCNTKILVNSSARTWKPCCDRKPIFLQGVNENKKLAFSLTGGTPDDAFAITLHGVQGNGCC